MKVYFAIIFAALTLSAQTRPEAQILPDPSRDPWQKPQQVISALNFAKGETVAVIENGYPYFAPRIAPFVGKVYAVNSDPRAFQGRGALPAGVSPIVAGALDPGLTGLNVDTIMMVDVLPLFQQRPTYYLGIASGLKRGGRIVIIDRNLPSTIPPPRNISGTQVLNQLSLNGFGFSANLSILPYQFLLIFTF